MSATKWFKFYGGEYLSDPKIESLTPQERSCWVTLMCLASMSHGDGLIEFLTKEVLLNKSGLQFDPYHPEEWDRALGVLDKFERMRMIKMSEKGDIKILNWEKRQETNLTDAERAKSYRDRKKVVTKTSHTRVTNVTQDKNRIDKKRIHIVAKATEQPLEKKEFNNKDSVGNLLNDESRDIKILGYYFIRKGIVFSSQKELSQAIAVNRNMINAFTKKNKMHPFEGIPSEKILKAMDYAKDKFPDWSLKVIMERCFEIGK